MATKQRRLTDELNVELSRISSALSVAEAILGEKCQTAQQKRAVLKLLGQASEGHKSAAEIGVSIARAVEQI